MHVAFKYNHIPSPRGLQMPVLHLRRTGLPSLESSYVQAAAANRGTALPLAVGAAALEYNKSTFTRLWSARSLD